MRQGQNICLVINHDRDKICVRCKKIKMGNIVYSLLWLLILIFVTFWLACFCAGIYIILLPFTACLDFLQPIADLLLQGIQTPLFATKAMLEGRPICS